MRLCEELETGQEVEVDMEGDVLTVLASGKQYPLKPIGDVRPLNHLVSQLASAHGGSNACSQESFWERCTMLACFACQMGCCWPATQ